MVILVSVISLTLGIMTIIVAPFIAKGVENVIANIPRFGRETDLSEGVINKYRQLGVQTIGSSGGVLCVKRNNGGFTWISVRREGLELVGKIDGEKKKWRDPLGNAGRLYGKVFGIAHEDSDILLSPADMSVAERYVEKEADNEAEREVSGETAFYNYTGFSVSSSRYVNVGVFPDIVRGNCDPRAALRVEEFVEKMFARFDSSPILDLLMIMAAYAVGVGVIGLMWYVAQSVGGGGGGGTPIPIGVFF